ncbi:Bifunctional non-homologous end joining protein LigD [Neobacillus rhizosphaerae]|uniref:DNA ligase (ATP) n=1 Tax=Neobacillus rhizosphaerae TaxID=2880965 RepID=A0ABM9EQC8_9BACI|nr:DNA ligase D [Neobacillus rhizosphaerae]CAH2714343.1 Bifunctional non-homologous end joining protein LigD [Neobacillus rhizosphaerae]
MKPMLPSLTFELPVRPNWLYEVKYDGFRAILDWNDNGIELTSRNGKPLIPQFPEIKEFLLKYEKQIKPFLPLELDGELVSLENPYKANFSAIQVRGRLKAAKKITEQAERSPCRLMVFDVLMVKGETICSLPYQRRKDKLIQLFQNIGLGLDANPNNAQLLQLVFPNEDFNELWENVVLYDGEGIIAKYQNSFWEEGKRSLQWLKYKNWKYVSCFVTSFDKTNGYFYVGLYKKNIIHVVGQVLFGFKPEEKQALQQTIKQNILSEDTQFINMEPSICLEVKYLELFDHQLREPHFDRFRFDLEPRECTYEQFIFQQKNLPADLPISHPDKPLWENHNIQKTDFILYLREVSPYMLPFLENRLLTVIRYPHGMFGEAFYQKNCPAYAPEFVHTHLVDDIDYILCNNLKTLIWLGNQLAIEFHIPFQTIHSKGPSEIVFDLDPPSKDAFHLAVKAALLIKEVFNHLNLIGFIKTSGNKGLQIYLPLPEGEYSYEDTRLFTTFIAEYLISQAPDSFTIERMKKNRGKRLYVDYVQHGEGKTIVAPYSMRGNEHAGVATPLYWEEVDEKLTSVAFNMESALNRLRKQGDPFRNYFQTKQIQPFAPVLEVLKKDSIKKG